MKKSISNSADIAKQLNHFQLLLGDCIEKIETTCNFSLDKLPQIDCGLVSELPADLHKAPQFQLTSGQVISLAAFSQHLSYEGFFEGIPHPYWAFKTALDAVRTSFPYVESSPAVLSPVLYVGTHGDGDGDGEDCMEWAVVPPICSVALFKSHSPRGEPTMGVVIWFQENFGLDLDERTTTQLCEIDWEAITVDASY